MIIRGRLRELVAGLVFLALVAASIWVSIAFYNQDFKDVVTVTLDTGDIGSSLQKGSDVEVRGIPVGRVTAIGTTGDGARLTLAIDAGQAHQISSGVTAQLLPKTLFGERYVSLELPATSGGATLQNGDVIHQDTSASGVELQQVFDELLPVLQAVRPDQLATLLGELSLALRDRGTELGDTLSIIKNYLVEFEPKIPQLTSDLAGLAKVADTYASATPALIGALRDFTTTSQVVVAQQQQLRTLFATVTGASNDVDGFLTPNAADIIQLSRDSLPSLQILAQYSGEFPCISQALADFVPTANAAFGAGTSQPGLHVKLQIVPSLGKYLPGQAPTPLTGGPRCPFGPVPSASSASSFAPAAKATASGTAPAATSSLSPASGDGLGPANSPQENELIAELIAPTMGLAPSAFPDWGSLLLGPVLRGAQVSVG